MAGQDTLTEIETRWPPALPDDGSSKWMHDYLERRLEQIRHMEPDVAWLVSEVKRLRGELENRPTSYWQPSPEWFQWVKRGTPIGEDY